MLIVSAFLIFCVKMANIMTKIKTLKYLWQNNIRENRLESLKNPCRAL
ncbi:Thioredoxin reductase [Legionella pneumophila subsp. pneumophila LPE509]|nr:Thioredoxin reductase [Legionella pneumophila subsp. pneumophila LPE509]